MTNWQELIEARLDKIVELLEECYLAKEDALADNDFETTSQLGLQQDALDEEATDLGLLLCDLPFLTEIEISNRCKRWLNQ